MYVCLTDLVGRGWGECICIVMWEVAQGWAGAGRITSLSQPEVTHWRGKKQQKNTISCDLSIPVSMLLSIPPYYITKVARFSLSSRSLCFFRTTNL